MWKVRSLNPSQVKQMTYAIDTRYLAWHSTLIGYGKDWLAQYQDNVTLWDSMSWCQQPDLPVEQHYKVAMSVH